MATELVNQGVEAYRAGDKDTARQLLSQAVELDPNDAKAWYYLAGTQVDIEDRRRSLERVLELMPDNEKAREALAKLPPRSQAPTPQADTFTFDEPEPAPPQSQTTSVGDDGEFVFNAPPAAGAGYVPPADIPAPSSGFKLPINIPGAPEFVDANYLIQQLRQQFLSAVAVLQRKPGAYPQEVQRATWWRFWSYVVVIYVIAALVSTITTTIAFSQLAGSLDDLAALGVDVGITRPNILNITLTFLLTIPVSIATLYVGLYASHWYMTNQANGQASLMHHAYAIMIPIVTVNIISAAIGLVFGIIPALSLVGGLITIVLFFYGLYVAADGIAMVHKSSGNTKYIALVVMILAQIAVGFVLGLVISPFILSAGFGLL